MSPPGSSRLQETGRPTSSSGLTSVRFDRTRSRKEKSSQTSSTPSIASSRNTSSPRGVRIARRRPAWVRDPM